MPTKKPQSEQVEEATAAEEITEVVEAVNSESSEAIAEVKKAKPAKKAGAKARKAKEEATTAAASRKEAPKQSQNPPRSQLERKSKGYRNAVKDIDLAKTYSLEEAAQLLPKTSYVKFDASVELHINLGVDPKQADQMVRGTVVLPHGTGKSQRVAVLADTADHKAAKDAGADVVGHEDLLEDIKKGKFDFDVLVATPAMMPQLGRYAKELGPKGLMPSPKSGTVTTEVAKAVKELKGGRVEFRIDRFSIIHTPIGKVSFTSEQITENARALFAALNAVKPASLKGAYIMRATLASTMGPGLKLDLGNL